MRVPRVTITNIGWVVVICLAALLVLPTLSVFWSFQRLER